MSRAQWIAVAVVGIVVAAHASFPPRLCQGSSFKSAGRAFVFSSDFHRANVRKIPESEWMPGTTDWERWDWATVDWPRFALQAVLILALGAVAVGCLGFARLVRGDAKRPPAALEEARGGDRAPRSS